MAHAGFEPAISALRGRCPGPLDECATHSNGWGSWIRTRACRFRVCRPTARRIPSSKAIISSLRAPTKAPVATHKSDNLTYAL